MHNCELKHNHNVFEGISSPRVIGVDGMPLASTRVVSNVMHEAPIKDMKDKTNSVVFMMYGLIIARTDTSMMTGCTGCFKSVLI